MSDPDVLLPNVRKEVSMRPEDKAKKGLELLKEAVCNFLEQHPDGVTNSVLANELDLKSDFEGRQKDYLSWSVLGLLVNAGKVKHAKRSNNRLYFINR
jgi:hypothetical protein